MDEEASTRNYGMIIAGLISAFWGYYEYSQGNSDNISHLPDIVTPTNTSCEENNGKLVYTSGQVQLHSRNSSPLKDDIFGISVEALKLWRQVEMLQWEQGKNGEINLTWSAYPINSEKFLPNFANPKCNLEKLYISVDGGLEVKDIL